MILINPTPDHDRDMPDKNLHSSVGGMTRDKVQVSSEHDRQLWQIFLCFITPFGTSNTILINICIRVRNSKVVLALFGFPYTNDWH